MDVITSTGGVVGGFLASDLIAKIVPIPALKGNSGRIAVKVAVGLLGGMVIKGAVNKQTGIAFGAGALASAVFDVITQSKAGGPVSGYEDYYDPELMGIDDEVAYDGDVEGFGHWGEAAGGKSAFASRLYHGDPIQTPWGNPYCPEPRAMAGWQDVEPY